MTTFNRTTQKRFIEYFIGLFYVLAAYKWLNGLWLYQVEPHFFSIPFDGMAWLLMQTGLHQWLLGNPAGWVAFDIAFYSMPFVWWLAWKKSSQGHYNSSGKTPGPNWPRPLAAIVWLVVNWLYVLCYTLFPTNSIEGHVGWLLLPILFACGNLKAFYLLLHAARYYFLFFFATAAIWKFRQGGVFNESQMSGILLMQHKEYLVAWPESWYTHFLYAIIRRAWLGYSLYWAGTLLELVFIIGFFTKKYDRLLFYGFLLFLAMDVLIMRIPYFELLPIALPLLFSKYTWPQNELEK